MYAMPFCGYHDPLCLRDTIQDYYRSDIRFSYFKVDLALKIKTTIITKLFKSKKYEKFYG